MFFKRKPEDMKAFTLLVTSWPTMSQFFWKKIGGVPSGPGDFRGLKEKQASLISLFVKGAFQ